MARKLKTFVTSLGFFELAVAAPSMKAALEAWGMKHNAFHQGFAKETEDPKIVAATMAKPGVVLRRPVGTKGAFAENAELPKELWDMQPSKAEPAKAKTRARPKSPAKAKVKAKGKPKAGKEEKTDRAAILSFEKAKARREREREQEDARREAKEERERAQRQRDTAKAEAALESARDRHDSAMAAIEKERDKLDRRAEIEKERWDAEHEDLKADLRRAKS